MTGTGPGLTQAGPGGGGPGPGLNAVIWPGSPAGPRQAGLVRDLKRAWEAGDIDAIIGLLAPAPR